MSLQRYEMHSMYSKMGKSEGGWDLTGNTILPVRKGQVTEENTDLRVVYILLHVLTRLIPVESIQKLQ